MGEQVKFSDFVAFLSSVRGDLSNITAPPFALAPRSVTELGSCWLERPAAFVAAAHEDDPQKRALLVLKWVLISLKTQFYSSGDTTVGLKKPLNAFLGELFMGKWKDETATVKLISEQVSHHPPITALYMKSDEFGIQSTAYSRVQMTFNGAISIKQNGHALLHIDKFDENHLIFLPDASIQGFWSGHLYPELWGTYHIVSSSGYVTEVRFSGAGYFTGIKNSFDAKIYKRDDTEKKAIYTAQGQWSDCFTFTDATDGAEIERWDSNAETNQPVPVTLEDPADQDPWETRRAWRAVLDGLENKDYPGVVAEKSKVEEAQRAMRKKEKADGKVWSPLLFTSLDASEYPLWNELAPAVGWDLLAAKTRGVWRYDEKKAEQAKKPYHGESTPLG